MQWLQHICSPTPASAANCLKPGLLAPSDPEKNTFERLKALGNDTISTIETETVLSEFDGVVSAEQLIVDMAEQTVRAITSALTPSTTAEVQRIIKQAEFSTRHSKGPTTAHACELLDIMDPEFP